MTLPIQTTLFPSSPKRDRAAYFRERRKRLGAIPKTVRRQKNIDKYNANPRYCKECGEVLVLHINEPPSEARKRRFCDKICSSKFNGRHKKRKCFCTDCECEIERTSKAIRKYCDKCLDAKRLRNIDNTTKGELFERRSGYQSARSTIRRHAELVFNRSGKPRECSICRYSLYVEIAHLHPVSEFSKSALLKEINAIANLIAFCANHHWEFDNGKLFDDNGWCGAQVAVEVS